ncbi:nuclear factor of activated T-cells, cytoplasmic 4-like, partial [Hemiscyllium ocellatum]|uniref:nuclear factor of activated T-cells, cytoplasmic 4-like n=1 Tax=Hemiscyllium ocellatum TaxID=170820 RepID=UPI002966E017
MTASARDDEDELDFRLTFGEEPEHAPSLLPPPPPRPRPPAVVPDLESDETTAYSTGPCLTVNAPIGIPRRRGRMQGRAGMHSPPPRPIANGDTYESQPARLIHLGGSKVLACPSIQITSISPGVPGGGRGWAEEEEEEEAWGLGERPYQPLDPFGYRGGSLSASPGSSSLSSPSGAWPSGTGSPFSSPSSPPCWAPLPPPPPFDEVEPELREAAYRIALAPPGRAWWAGDEASSSSPSPGAEDPLRLSPRGPGSGPPSRPTSPGGKRRHSGFEAYSYPQHQHRREGRGGGRRQSPSPGEGGGAAAEEPPRPPEGSPLPPPPQPSGLPSKARRTSQGRRAASPREGEGGGQPGPGAPYHSGEPGPAQPPPPALKMDAMEYLTVPSPFVWNKARLGGHSPVFRSTMLPPLDWPLPSQWEQLELTMEIQPRTHHRAHYETEGSRGAVKGPGGGHPVVK